MGKTYDFSVWGTQGGGLVRAEGGGYVFVEKPDCPGFDVGDRMPEKWSTVPVNEHARNQSADQAEFERGIDSFCDLLMERVEAGETSLSQARDFFPH